MKCSDTRLQAILFAPENSTAFFEKGVALPWKTLNIWKQNKEKSRHIYFAFDIN